MTNRNSVQIMSHVLANVDDAGIDGLGITRIIQKANLSHSRLQKLIHNLTGSELMNKIECNGKFTFVITEKGRLFLEEYRKFSDFAVNFGLEI